MKDIKLITEQVMADQEIKAFLIQCSNAWSLQYELAERTSNMSPEELDCVGNWDMYKDTIKKIEMITGLGDLSMFRADFYSMLLDCVFTFSANPKEQEAMWQEDIVEWVSSVHENN